MRHTALFITMTALGAVFALPLPAHGQALAPFAGNWKGKGSVQLDGGQKETVTCRADNGMLSSGQFAIVLKCATAGGKIELRSKVKESAGKLSGTWRDVTYGNEGTLGGTVADDALDARISGPVISGTVKVRRDGATLHITASLTKGVKSITVAMNR